jgi:predicted PolB exonuclease-like 3'-5' exonuclease
MIRKWKRRKAASLTDSESKKAQTFVSKWQKKQRGLIDKTERRRKYGREQVDKPR